MEVPKGVVLQMTTRGGSKSGSILMYSNFKMLKQTFLQPGTDLFSAEFINLITLDFVHCIGFVARCFLSSLPFDCTSQSELFDFFSK